jgi:hypothetical protein
MGQAEVISLDEVRASKQWASLRQQLHDAFALWLDDLQAQLPKPETTLAQVTETVWALRQDLTYVPPGPRWGFGHNLWGKACEVEL